MAGGVHPHPCGPLTAARRGSQAWEAQHTGRLSPPTFWASTGREEATRERRGPVQAEVGGPAGLLTGRHAGPTRPAARRSAGSPRPGGAGDTAVRGPDALRAAARRPLAQSRPQQRRSQRPRRTRPAAVMAWLKDGHSVSPRTLARGRCRRTLPPASRCRTHPAGSAWETAVCIPGSHEPAKNGACVTVGGQGNGFGGTAGSSCLNVQPAQFPETIG